MHRTERILHLSSSATISEIIVKSPAQWGSLRGHKVKEDKEEMDGVMCVSTDRRF